MNVNHKTERLLWVSIYAVAMALLEAAVVVYLRGLLDVSADRVSLGSYGRVEVGREVATVVMLVAVGWLSGKTGADRLAYGLLAFGLWDIGYYAWLRVLIGWPATLLDWDLLFLVPLPWWGPVLAPALIAALICANAVLALGRLEREERPRFTPARVGLVTTGGALALYVFTSDSLHAFLKGWPNWYALRPGPFRWSLFLVALALMALPSLTAQWSPGLPGKRLNEPAPEESL